MILFFRLVNDYVNCFKFGDSLPKRCLQGDKNIAGILFENTICTVIFTKFFDIRHLYLPAASECQAGVGLCPVTWITMNHHSQYWAQWHFKSLLAIEWGSHLAWMNKRGRMEGGREEDEEEGGRQREEVKKWAGREEEKAESIEFSPCGAKTQFVFLPASESLTPSNSSGSTTSMYQNHLNGWFRPRVQESTQGLGAWLAVNPHRTFLDSISSVGKCTSPCPTLKICVLSVLW